MWIELATMPERGRPHRKSKENLRFFNIFSLEASKTNGFSTFSLRKLQKPKDFQWLWGQASAEAGPGLTEPTGLGQQGLQGQANQTER